jgi:hypothetical protein
MNVFDLVQIRADISEMSDTDLGSVVFFPADADGEARYSQLDTLSAEQYRQGGYVNSYSPKAHLVELWEKD